MKSFLTWLGICFLFISALAVYTHWDLESNPKTVLVVVDSSFPMAEKAFSLKSALKGVLDQRYTRFALADKMALLQNWTTGTLPLEKITFYGSRDLKALGAEGENLKNRLGAERVVYVTNAPDLGDLGFSEVIRLEP